MKRKPSRTFWTCFAICLLVAIVFLTYPVYVIRPFRAQQARELTIALAVIRYRPVVMILSVLGSLGILIWYWRREHRRIRRAFSAAGIIVILGVAFLSRINIYEIMFHPLDHPMFSSVDQTKLDKDEKVIAVSAGSDARAYPIRIISYHHIVNDMLNGVPIVATY